MPTCRVTKKACPRIEGRPFLHRLNPAAHTAAGHEGNYATLRTRTADTAAIEINAATMMYTATGTHEPS